MVLLSGGIDSATCLYVAKRDGYSLRALTVRIHGTADAELRAARRIARAGGVLEHRFLSVPQLREAGDIRGSKGFPKGAVPPSYIPMKNAVFYSLAAAYAEEAGAEAIIGGHNADDQRVFSDTSEGFFAELERAFSAGSPRLEGLKILRPLRSLSKAQVVTTASGLGVPFALTWSCHLSGARHCWRCAGCVQRRKAFDVAGVRDPLMPKKV